MADSSGKNGGEGSIFIEKNFRNHIWQSSDTSEIPLLPNEFVNYKFTNAKYGIEIKRTRTTLKFPKVNEILTLYCNECLQTYFTIAFIELVNRQFSPTNIFDFKDEKLEYAISLYNRLYNLSSTLDSVRNTLSFYFSNSLSLIGLSSDTATKLANLKNSLKSIEIKYADKLIQEVSPNMVTYENGKLLDAGTIKWFNSQKAGAVLDKEAADWFINRANEEMKLDIEVHFAEAQIKAVMFNADAIISDPRFRMSLEDSRWNEYDDTIKKEVAFYNQKFAASPGFVPLDWRYVKAMIWTEILAGPNEKKGQWQLRPMQIGRFAADAGYLVVSKGLDNSDLVTSSELRQEFQNNNNVIGKTNVKAGIAYLFTKAIDGKVFLKEVIDNPQILNYIVQSTDRKGLDDIAKRLETTSDNVIKNTNGLTKSTILHSGLELKYQKAHLEKSISGWIDWETSMRNYNSKTPEIKGDVKYVDKFNRAYQIIISRTPQ